MSFQQQTGAYRLAVALCSFGLIALSGCGTPGAPQPPSLKLPEPVKDLTAVRAGGSVTLRWTMPRKNTDHLLLKGPIPVSICWRQASETCQSLAKTQQSPEAKAEFQSALPAALASGDPRPISLFVELDGPKGRSAGLSNPAVILAGSAPGPVLGLTAQVRADGVALHWTGSAQTLIRLHRTLITPAAKPAAKSPDSDKPGSLKPAEEPLLRDLLVDPPAAGQSPGANQGAIDRTARFGQVYEYTAQRLVQIQVNGATEELAGETCAPVRVATVDTFPPAVPQGLAAVYTPEAKTIDLSWEPDTDEDLAGYAVYRAAADGQWMRISGPKPLVGSAYRDTSVQPGNSYRYAVSALDQLGHESNRSAEASESVPNP
jgi:hypothetical protein